MGRGRYAPSPTGPLHLGNVRTALLAWLHARLTQSVFVLRMEDIDGPRCRPGAAETILDDLRWLGLDWDEGPDVGGTFGPYTQSENTAAYQSALDSLVSKELAYPCWCSRREIAEASSAPHGATPIYPGTCSHLSPEQRAARQAEQPDRIPSWRFRVGATVTVVDGLLGPITQNLSAEVGDFVLKRADGLWAYQLAVVVDDIQMKITDVVRGADLADSAPRQAALFSALGADVPTFWHVPLMLDADGHRMSKRDGSESLRELRQTESAEKVVGRLAASLGWADIGTELSATTLLQDLSLEQFRNLRASTAS
ncbi:MAG: tRNA glutamyl-Q(34) synthetase GluQRS [bacterium]